MKLGSRVFCLLAAAMVWLPATGQNEPRVNETMVTRPAVPAAASGPLSKTSEEVVAAAKANQMQRLGVTLDDSDILEVFKQKVQQATIHSNPNDQNDQNDRAKLVAALEEARQKTDALKQAVFPNGFRLRAKVFSGPSHVALLWVDIPDFESLLAILSDPRVIQVSRGQYAHFSRANDFNPIGQPAAIAAGHGAGNAIGAVIDTG